MPFLVNIPHFPVEKGKITDEDIKEKNRGYSIESEVIRLEEEMEKLVRTIKSLSNKEEHQEVLSEKERNFLVDIAKFPVSGVTTRYSRLGLNRYQGNKIQNERCAYNKTYSQHEHSHYRKMYFVNKRCAFTKTVYDVLTHHT